MTILPQSNAGGIHNGKVLNGVGVSNDLLPLKSDDVESATSSEPREREHWNNWWEFLLSLVGYSVGLGNIWRFPYLCYKHGGGAFLIPYLIFLVVGGIPLFFLEVSLGQFTQRGGIEAWKLTPLFQGIGYASILIAFYLNNYYIVVLGWTLHYFGNSFQSPLPWEGCGHTWNTDKCFDPFTSNLSLGVDNSTTRLVGDEHKVDPAVEYWERRVLNISDGIDEPGPIQWELLLALLGAWVLCYFCIWKGVKVTGKVVYFTAIFPYVMLVVLFIRGITLDGAMEGINFYIKPNMTHLSHSQVWLDAGTQVFFSYSIGLGSLVSLGSYNKFRHNCFRDSVAFATVNSCTSIFGGFVIFSVLGFMAHEQGVTVDKVAESGPGLLFIAYPKAISRMPVSPLWAVLFFFMIVILGIDSQFVNIEGVVTAIIDLHPRQLRRGWNREIFVAILCSVSYLIGFTMITRGGMYVFQIFDSYSASGMALLAVTFWECFAISWVYGSDRYASNIHMAIGLNPKILRVFQFCWKFLTPSICMAVFLFQVIKHEPLKYNNVYIYPSWAYALGWIMSLSSMLMPIVVAVFKILRTSGSLKERVKKLCQPIYVSKHFEEENFDTTQLTSRPSKVLLTYSVSGAADA